MTTTAPKGRGDGRDAEIERRLAAIEIEGETATPVTDAFFARVPEAAVTGLVAALTAEERADLDRTRPGSPNHKRKVLQLGVGRGFPGFEKAGLLSLQVPDDVHSVVGARQPAGNIRLCDMFVEALAAAGAEIAPGDRILDFGASSGRVIRNLAAYYPQAACEGCDPRRETIEWASANIPTVRFFVSPVLPPLPVEAGRYKAVYAVSVWSHFGEPAALAWFDEMHRVIAPGGLLVFTTHGYASILHRRKKADPGVGELGAILDALDAGRLLFRRYPDSKIADDLDRDNWGVAYMPRAWVEAKLGDDWELPVFRQGRLVGNQDVHVLRRRPGEARARSRGDTPGGPRGDPPRRRGLLRLFGR